MPSEIRERTVVFRGTEPAELDLVEGRLELEGLQPLRLGRAQPALAGGGNSAFEQLITVPNKHLAAARALLAPSDEAELERQALSAEPLPGGTRAPAPEPAPDSGKTGTRASRDPKARASADQAAAGEPVLGHLPLPRPC